MALQRRRQHPQPVIPSGFSREESVLGETRATVWPSALASIIYKSAEFRAQRKTEDTKLRKELLEVLALKVPFRSLLFPAPESKPRGRGEFLRYQFDVGGERKDSACRPQPTRKYQIAGRARELQKRPTSHPVALGLLFIPEVGEKVQGGIDFFHESLWPWFRRSDACRIVEKMSAHKWQE